MSKLIVICEGGVHTAEYIIRNGVYPNALVLETSKFQDMVPYLKTEDEILLIIKGLTDFTMSEIYALLTKFNEHKDKVKRITVLSNIDLGVVDFEYYFYKRDLFYGEVQKVIDRKYYDLDAEGNIDTSKKNKFKNKNTTTDKNVIMWDFKNFNKKDTKMQIYGRTAREEVETDKVNYYFDNIKVIDLYN